MSSSERPLTLPTQEEVHSKSPAARTALDWFIHDNEPVGRADRALFRGELLAVLTETRDVTWADVQQFYGCGL